MLELIGEICLVFYEAGASSQREQIKGVFHSSLAVESPWLKTESPRLEAHDQRTRKDVDKLMRADGRGFGKRITNKEVGETKIWLEEFREIFKISVNL